MVLISERILAKSFVVMTFLGIGFMFLHVAKEKISQTSKPIASVVFDGPNFKDISSASTGNVIATENNAAKTKSKESGTKSLEPLIQGQNAKVMQAQNGKSSVLNSGDIRRSNSRNVSTAKLNTAHNSKIIQAANGQNIPQDKRAVRNPNNIQPLNTQNVRRAQENPAVFNVGAVVVPDTNNERHFPQENMDAGDGLPVATQIPPCKRPGENLVGRVAVDQSVPNMEDIAKSWDEENWVIKGGAWRPTICQAVSKVAIIIPYRDRYPHLKIFLRHIHPILKRQLLDYRIIVVEQNGNTPFNRAMLFNIGYKEALAIYDFQCFVFHDVDLLPEDDRNYYGCPLKPRHLSVAVDKFQYRLPYAAIFGGVGSFSKEQFEKINGFSNKFWGWGGEDDDLYQRIRAVNYTLSRPMIALGRYTMLKIGHKSAPKDPARHEKLKNSAERMTTDGLNSLIYDIVKTEEHQLYTQITVDVDPNAV